MKNPDEAERAAREMIGMRLVTYQTGADGQVVQRVLVEQGLRIQRELYLGLVLDRASEKPALMASPDGGVEIEKVAHETPDRIFKEFIHPGTGLAAYQTRKLAFALGLQGAQLGQAGKWMAAVYDTFKSTDASLIEINPLIVTEDGNPPRARREDELRRQRALSPSRAQGSSRSGRKRRRSKSRRRSIR